MTKTANHEDDQHGLKHKLSVHNRLIGDLQTEITNLREEVDYLSREVRKPQATAGNSEEQKAKQPADAPKRLVPEYRVCQTCDGDGRIAAPADSEYTHAACPGCSIDDGNVFKSRWEGCQAGIERVWIEVRDAENG